MSDGYIGLFYTPEPGVPIAQTTAGSSNTISVTESIQMDGEKTISVGLITLSDT